MIDNKSEKEKILSSVREGLEKNSFKKIDKPELTNRDLFVTSDKPLPEMFMEELTKISGECYYLQNKSELTEKLIELNLLKKLDLCYCPNPDFHDIVRSAQINFTEKFENPAAIKSGISNCEFLVARFGSVLVSSALPGGRRIFSFPEIHIVIADENQLMLELDEALETVRKKYGDELPSQITNITGPSRTADIEKTLILGAHGPKQLIVLIVKSF